MRKRNVKIQLYLNEQESALLTRRARQSGLSRSVYLRSLIAGQVPQPLPPIEYYQLLSQLSELKQIVIEMRNALYIYGEFPVSEQLDEIRLILLHQMKAVSAAAEGRCKG